MVIIELLVTLLILGVNVVLLTLFFLVIKYLDTKFRNNKYREPILITALFIYLLVMVVFSKLLKSGFTIIWG